jgi:dynein intermediate chain 2
VRRQAEVEKKSPTIVCVIISDTRYLYYHFRLCVEVLTLPSSPFRVYCSSASPRSSFVWDINSPNRPDVELSPPSPLTSLRFNPKVPDTLLGGCQNGLVCVFDLRRQGSGGAGGSGAGQGVVGEASVLEHSHHDPVRDVFWISSKTGHQCVSISTDGQMLWWDTRRLTQPTDALPLLLPLGPSLPSSLLGATALDYSLEAGPTKYLIGTEQGLVLSLNLRNRRHQQQPPPSPSLVSSTLLCSQALPTSPSAASSSSSGLLASDPSPLHKHYGPILSLHRNPTHPKFYASVGDWRASFWADDVRSPLFSTPFLPSPITAGCWSPTRPSLFFLARQDGKLEGWDLLEKQGEKVFSHKVGDTPITALASQGGSTSSLPPSATSSVLRAASMPWTGGNEAGGGRLMAVGDEGGTVALLELCRGLSECQAGEKAAMGALLEREMRVEKNMEARERESRRAAGGEEGGREGGKTMGQGGARDEEREEKMAELLREVDADFLSMIKEAEETGEAGSDKEC